MLRRIHSAQPETFEFTPANLKWAEEQIKKYPEGRQQSAVIPILWRAQEQEGWVTRPAMEYIANLLSMPYMRVLEVATFYFMFQLQPVGDVAHVQICGTTSCMIMGSDDLVAICKKRISDSPHTRSENGKFSWEEVECLGACTNAPMAQIGKDYYEDLTPESFEALLDAWEKEEYPVSGPQNGRFGAMAMGEPSNLVDAPVEVEPSTTALALEMCDGQSRISGEIENDKKNMVDLRNKI